MNIYDTDIEGLFLIQTKVFNDDRGIFQKMYNMDFFKENNLESDFKEFYFSISKKDTIRGMHFQTPPKDHVKLVYVSYGSIVDVVVDLRKNSSSFGKIVSKEIDYKSGYFLYLPKGVAHGFRSLEDNTIVNYAQTTCYSKENDMGVLYDSFGFNWGINSPVISQRDASFPTFDEFTKRSIF